ncbi:MAG TPA: Sec-independent protein translocase protein TatB [Bauldia sp.]|nr:Sec-independent protein translocase protein TatB [Bauldia sp.]
MFEIGWTELVLIAVVAIVVIGPKDLPRAMRIVGQWTARMKRMARDFQGQFNEALKEAELDGVQKDLQSLSKIDPIGRVRKELTAIETSIKKDMTPLSVPAVPAVPQPPEGPAVPQPPEPPKVAP